jgi:CDP-diacylglycerol--serine O-phosphatidyltransferase
MSAALVQGLALIAPVVAAGLAHQVARARGLLPALTRSLDDALFGGWLLFGANKTLRGFVVVPVACALAFALEPALVGPGPLHAALPGATSPAALLVRGFVVGLAYVAGELPNSFVKRRLGIAPGAQAARARAFFFALDHLDSAAACALAYRACGAPWPAIVTALAAAPLLHVAVNRAAYGLGLRRAAW